ncbi:MAG TPA: hypothetical protein VLY24_04720 [Bryobacteraceae bacterium]|nr:hypothetical protein [Bryobacteraceae bacterium]
MPKPAHSHPLSAGEQQQLIDRLDDLLLELGHDPSPWAGLTLEHMAGVRTCLIECMPGELALNLDLAEDSLAALPDRDLKARIQEFLRTFRGAGTI